MVGRGDGRRRDWVFFKCIFLVDTMYYTCTIFLFFLSCISDTKLRIYIEEREGIGIECFFRPFRHSLEISRY